MSLNQSLRTLKPGDSVYVWEGYQNGYKRTIVTNVTPTRIKVQRHNNLAFDRDTGNANGVTQRFKTLHIVEEVEKEQGVINRREKLIELMNKHHISEKQFEKCYEAIEQILGE
jgi:type III secretion system FlhB-like substrate exporter